MPLYFPRNKEEEEFATKALPLDLGDKFGEPIIQERKIRIANTPLGKGNVRLVCLWWCLRCIFCADAADLDEDEAEEENGQSPDTEEDEDGDLLSTVRLLAQR